MKPLFLIPLLATGLLFAGCEGTVVDRYPTSGSRRYSQLGYYRSEPTAYRSSYGRSSSYDRPYERSRTAYRSDVNYRNTVVNETNVNRTTVNRTDINERNVTRNQVNRTRINAPASRASHYQPVSTSKSKEKAKKKPHHVEG